MAVMERKAWSDERLDDLRDDMNRRFGEVKGEIRELRDDMNRRFGEVDRRFGEVDRRFGEVKGEIRDLRIEVAGLQRTMIVGFVSLFASIVAALVGVAFVA